MTNLTLFIEFIEKQKKTKTTNLAFLKLNIGFTFRISSSFWREKQIVQKLSSVVNFWDFE